MNDDPNPDLARFDLTDRVCVVTGGSRGIGKEMVLAFARAGADVVIASRKLENCTDLAARVEQETERSAHPVACHVGHWEQCDALIESAIERFGRIDVLVNNAGMSPLYPSLDAVSEELYDKVMSVNLKGPFRLSALAGSHMRSRGRGSIINVSSVAAVRPTPTEAVYAAAKSGLNNLTSALAQEFGPEVRVNCIMPGPFLTDISKAWDMEAFNKRAEETIPLRRGGQAEEVVGAALYFASDASTYTSGAILKIDGGIA